MAPLMEAKALAALLRALSTVGFAVSGVFWVSRRQRVARGGWRIANWVVQSWNSLPQRPEQYPKAEPIAARDSHRYMTGAMLDADFYEKALFVERPVARFNYSDPSLKMCRLADAPVGLWAYAAVVA